MSVCLIQMSHLWNITKGIFCSNKGFSKYQEAHVYFQLNNVKAQSSEQHKVKLRAHIHFPTAQEQGNKI